MATESEKEWTDVSNDGMVLFNQIFEYRVTEHTTRMLGLFVWQGCLFLAEVHIHYVGSTVITKLLRHAHFVGILKEVDHHLALVASHPPFWVGGWVQHQNPCLTLHTLTHPVLDQRVLTGRMSALVAAKLFTHVRKRRIVEAVRAERETFSPDSCCPENQFKVI